MTLLGKMSKRSEQIVTESTIVISTIVMIIYLILVSQILFTITIINFNTSSTT